MQELRKILATRLLLNPLLLAVPAHQSVEYRKDVAPIFHDAEENIAQPRLALGLAVPFCEDCRRNFNIAPELLWRVAPQKKAVEKGSLALRKLEVIADFHGNELCHRGHKGKCSLPKSVSASSSTERFVQRARQCPFRYQCKVRYRAYNAGGCQAVLTAVG